MYAIRSYYDAAPDWRVLADRRVGAATGLHALDALDRQGPRAREELGILLGVNVITSYSIHYTKLYDDATALRCLLRLDFVGFLERVHLRFLLPLLAGIATAIVITSYSIHYTKLYDSHITVKMKFC